MRTVVGLADLAVRTAAARVVAARVAAVAAAEG